MKEKILQMLLAKYEKSHAYHKQNGKGSRVQLKLQKLKWIDLEDYDAKESFYEAVYALEALNLVFYKWVKYEEDNLMDSVGLNCNPDVLDLAYQMAGRQSKLSRQEFLIEQIREMTFLFYPWLNHLKESMLTLYEKKKDVSNDLYADPEISENMIKLLLFLEAQKGEEIHERVLSAQLFGDSKYFRKELKGRLQRLIERFDLCEKSDEELLSRVGIVINPESIAFCGSVEIRIDGRILDFGLLKKGASIPGASVNLIESIHVYDCHRVIFVENSASYEGLIKQMPQGTLAVYHGGFAGLSKRSFFQKLYETNRSLNYMHWSDIDLGGFRIFNALIAVIPIATSMLMDIKTLEEHKVNWISFDSVYGVKLKKMREQGGYGHFYDVIDFMLNNSCRLEQEQIYIEEVLATLIESKSVADKRK